MKALCPVPIFKPKILALNLTLNLTLHPDPKPRTGFNTEVILKYVHLDILGVSGNKLGGIWIYGSGQAAQVFLEVFWKQF